MTMNSSGPQTSVPGQAVLADNLELLVLIIPISRLREERPLPGADGLTDLVDWSNESYSAEQAAEDRRASILEAM